jgi:hypothetical protein
MTIPEGRKADLVVYFSNVVSEPIASGKTWQQIITNSVLFKKFKNGKLKKPIGSWVSSRLVNTLTKETVAQNTFNFPNKSSIMYTRSYMNQVFLLPGQSIVSTIISGQGDYAYSTGCVRITNVSPLANTFKGEIFFNVN